MNKRFLALAGLATVLSVGTYVVLNVVKPYKHETPKVADVTSPDQVFGASIDNPEAHAEGEAAAAPAVDGAAGDVAAVQPVDTAVQPAGSVDSAAAATSSGDGSVAPLVPAGAVAAAPAAAADTSAPVDTASAEQPAAESYSEPVAEAAPAPEPTPAPAPAPKPKKKSASKSASSGSTTWWPAEKADKLSLVYAGPASYKKAVVLMFNGAFFQADTVNANIKITDKAGKAVSGAWELGENNRRMVVFPVDAAGTYKVSIASGLTDSKGRKFGSKLGGPVQVK